MILDTGSVGELNAGAFGGFANKQSEGDYKMTINDAIMVNLSLIMVGQELSL